MSVIQNSIDSQSKNLLLSATSATAGQIKIGGSLALHTAGGHDNIFAGQAGNTAVTAVGTSGLGFQSLLLLTSGNNNTACGANSLNALLTGTTNCVFGASSGTAYTSSESNNICIGFDVTGTVAESNVTRIGVQGTQTLCVIAGVYGETAAAGNVVAVSSTGIHYDSTNGAGNVILGNSTSTSTTTIQAGSGKIVHTGASTFSSTVVASGIITGAGIIVSANPGAGVVSTLTLTNATNTTQSTGSDTIKSTTAGSNSNTGFIEVYVGTVLAYIPYWTTP